MFAYRKNCLFICWKSSLNKGDSKSVVVIGVWKSRKWCASLLLLEDYKRSHSGRLVHKFDNSENLSWGLREFDYSCLKRVTSIYLCVIYFYNTLFFCISIIIKPEK